MLRPDAGQVFLGGEDVTRLEPARRVRRGLARTFQLNTLFPHLTALESVTAAACERRGVGATWWRSLAGYPDEVDEAHGILVSLGLGAVGHRPTRALAYGQQR